MSNLDDLETKSISEMTTDEALELLRQVRLSRRVPVKPMSKAKERKKKLSAPPAITAEDAAELLKILGGK